MMRKDYILSKIKEVVSKTAPEAEVFLYGSKARGDEKADSDWDLLILLNSKTLTFEFEIQFINAFYDIEIETGEIISPLIYSKADWIENHAITPLYENVQKDGVRIK